MASVLLIFGLGGLALLGRESATNWQSLTLMGVAGVVSVSLLWAWRAADWSETFWEDAIFQRMHYLEEQLGFLTNRAIRFVLEPEDHLRNDPYWKKLDDDEREIIIAIRGRGDRPLRLRHLFNFVAAVGTFGWIGLFGLRLVEFITTR